MTTATVMRRALRPIWVILALAFLFEAWLWSFLAPIVAFIVAGIPLKAIKLKLASSIEKLPPAATLIVFIVPALLLLPLKFLGLWLFAQGYWLGALAMLALAKVVSLGVTAFIFEVTKPKLLQMAWFRRFYEWVMWLLERAHAIADPVKRRIKIWFRMFSPKRASRTMRLLIRIRRRMQAHRPA